MTKRDIFKSIPAEGAIERDWTQSTVTVDITNSIGEKYHFEIEPGEDPKNLPSSSSLVEKPGNRNLITLPIATSEE